MKTITQPPKEIKLKMIQHFKKNALPKRVKEETK